MTPDDERRAAAVPGVPVAERLRALADAPWSERGDEATRGALLAGADEVERLARALADERDTVAFHVDLAESALRDLHAVCDALGARARRGDPLPSGEVLVGVAQALRAQAGAPALEVDALRLALSGAQYREREARNEVAMLRARLDRALDDLDAAENRVENLEIARTIGPRVDEVRRALAQATAPDLAALARREAGSVTRRQWRACARCGREHWLADEEAAPLHGGIDALGSAWTCATAAGEGSEGR